MRFLTAVIVVILVSGAEAWAQSIPWAQEQPEWVFQFMVEDGTGQRDTVYFGYHPAADVWGNLDTLLGEVPVPLDTNFHCWLGSITNQDTIVKARVVDDLYFGFTLHTNGVTPLTIQWVPELMYDASMPFPDLSPAPNAELLLWFDVPLIDSALACNFGQPILITDSTMGPSATCNKPERVTFVYQLDPTAMVAVHSVSFRFRPWTGGWVGIEEAESNTQQEIQLWPNPVAHEGVLHIEAPERIRSVSVFTMQGTQVLQSEYHPVFDTSSLSPGVYLFVANANNNAYRKRLVISHNR